MFLVCLRAVFRPGFRLAPVNSWRSESSMPCMNVSSFQRTRACRSTCCESGRLCAQAWQRRWGMDRQDAVLAGWGKGRPQGGPYVRRQARRAPVDYADMPPLEDADDEQSAVVGELLVPRRVLNVLVKEEESRQREK